MKTQTVTETNIDKRAGEHLEDTGWGFRFRRTGFGGKLRGKPYTFRGATRIKELSSATDGRPIKLHVKPRMIDWPPWVLYCPGSFTQRMDKSYSVHVLFAASICYQFAARERKLIYILGSSGLCWLLCWPAFGWWCCTSCTKFCHP